MVKKRGDHSPVAAMGKTGLTWGSRFDLSPIKITLGSAKLPAKLRRHLPPLPLCQARPHGQLFHLLPSSSPAARRKGGRGQSLAALRRRSFLLMLLPCRSLGSLPRAAVPSGNVYLLRRVLSGGCGGAAAPAPAAPPAAPVSLTLVLFALCGFPRPGPLPAWHLPPFLIK